MKVNPNQNSGVPAQSEANAVDGTSNTIMFGESAKAENPFAKDTFESFRFEMGSLPCFGALDGAGKDPTAVQSAKDQLSGLKAQDQKSVEQPVAKKSFMDYTDDSCD